MLGIISTIVVALIVAGVIGIAVYSLVKKKKNGGGCHGDCSSCNCCKK